MPIYFGSGLQTVFEDAVVIHLGYEDVAILAKRGEETDTLDEIHFVMDTDGKLESKAVLVFDSIESIDSLIKQAQRIRYDILNTSFKDLK